MLADRYRMVRSLGQGGMGQVWEAHDQTLWRPVAVKLISVLAGAGSRADEARARFLREARITAALQHPNIVTVHDLGQAATAEGTTPFLVMELLRGEGLDSILRRGPVSLAHAASWGEQIAAALGHAHLAGVLHRDIKPGNILITAAGAVKVLDFGIARAADPAAGDDLLTQPGCVVGTPPYMAPEQARGRPEASSDQYGLGCLLFEMITGRRPFDAPDTMGYVSAHLTEAPPAPSSVATGIPAEWDQVILRLLQKDPAQRYGSAAELAAALAQLARDPLVPVPVGAPDPGGRPAPSTPAGAPSTHGTGSSLAAPSFAAPSTHGAGAPTQAPPARAKRRFAHAGILAVLAISLVLAGRWYEVSLGSSTPSASETPAEGAQDKDSEEDTTPSPSEDDKDDKDDKGGKDDKGSEGDKGDREKGEADQSPEDAQQPPADNEPQPPAEEPDQPAEQQPDAPAEQQPDQPAEEEPNPPAEEPVTPDPGAPGREHCNFYNGRTIEVSRGMTGNAVREVQCLLFYNYGRDDVVIDGDFGPVTEAAVKDVQRCSGVTVDGIVGPAETWPLLDDPKPQCVP